jgi:thiosulfate/3-mercaptopyruvate sulfurtransferase
MHLSLLAPVALLLAADTAPARYPRPELLVEPTELAKPLIAKEFRILDARAKDSYQGGHVPGAVWLNHAEWAKAFAKGQDAAEWAKRIGALGIDSKTKVVVYDDALAKDAARVWWILRYWGVKDARLLNGGWPAWQASELPVSKEDVRVTAASFSVPTAEEARLATKDQILQGLKDSKFQIIDARSEEEYCGDAKTAKRNGAIPGALHLEWTEALDKKTQRFKGPAELQALLKKVGIDLSRPTVTHCQSGGRAAVMAFTLELMGAKEVRNYYRSWSEWGNADDTPVVRPKQKNNE